jgi:hypothetical protein
MIVPKPGFQNSVKDITVNHFCQQAVKKTRVLLRRMDAEHPSKIFSFYSA